MSRYHFKLELNSISIISFSTLFIINSWQHFKITIFVKQLNVAVLR